MLQWKVWIYVGVCAHLKGKGEETEGNTTWIKVTLSSKGFTM